jgi:integrase/recombinase XerD
LNCSLRLSELVGINLSDLKIDTTEQTLKVTGKGNKQRIIYLNDAVCEAINEYMKIHPNLDKSNNDYNALFLSSRNKRISRRSIQDFVNYLVAIRNLSDVYIKNMTVTIEQFLEFINVHKFKSKYNTINDMSLNEIRSLNNSDIYSFIFFLAESHYQNNSRVIKIEHLKTFFDYLFRIKNTLFTEPFKKINTERKIAEKLPNYLSLDEAKRLINLYKDSYDEIEIRDNAMLHIFLNCGLRLSEIKNLNIEDINLEDNKFVIIGKGNKERTNYLNKQTKDALLKYLKIRNTSQDNPKKHNNALFLTFYGYRMSQFTINKIVKRAYRKANLDDKVYTVHTLRHTCATLLYRAGVNLKTIQELLGYVQIDTTEIYTHLHNQEVLEVMMNHPLAQFKMENALAYCA